MTQANLMELAKQGNPQAIAALMNRSLQPKGITASAERQGNILNITLELAKAVDPNTLVAFVEKGMTNLGVQTISKVRVFGQQPGESVPLWQQEILLAPEEEQEEEEYFFPMNDAPEEDNLLENQYLDNDDDLPPDYPEDIEDAESGDYFEEEINDDLENSAEVEPAKPQKKKLPLIIGGVVLGLGLLGGLIYFLLPTITSTFLSKGNTESNSSASPTTAPAPATNATTAPAPAANATTAPAPAANATTAPAPAAKPAVNYWYQGVKKAQSAATLAQTAASQAEWTQVANEWQAASNLMKQVPQSDPNYQTAQQKATEYQGNVAIAEQRAANSYY